ncbi:hypothetical protein AAHA92_32398 [Salvia divinorum]|uniref:Uncharacterized protein n=1 Tax=Salvia divinorum TaxID=28513 RepID=A0ABD1FKL6_SALDI
MAVEMMGMRYWRNQSEPCDAVVSDALNNVLIFMSDTGGVIELLPRLLRQLLLKNLVKNIRSYTMTMTMTL